MKIWKSWAMKMKILPKNIHQYIRKESVLLSETEMQSSLCHSPLSPTQANTKQSVAFMLNDLSVL